MAERTEFPSSHGEAADSDTDDEPARCSRHGVLLGPEIEGLPPRFECDLCLREWLADLLRG